MARLLPVHDSSPLMVDSVAGVRQLDQAIIDAQGDDGLALMTEAGEAAFAALQALWPEASRIGVLAGAGNNGGDGWVVARLAQAAGLSVCVLSVGDDTTGSSAALAARAAAETDVEGEGVTAEPLTTEALDALEADVIVDGLLGTGLASALRAPYPEWIEQINQHPAAVLALDVPSGLNADTGQIMGACVKADATVTFISVKTGLLTGDGPDVTGVLDVAPLSLDALAREQVTPLAQRINARQQLLDGLPERRGNSNKGQYGHALMIGGTQGLGGAVAMAVDACCRSGAGLTSCATHPDNQTLVLMHRPECMAQGIGSGLELLPMLERATVIGCGPGLGTSSWSELLLQQTLLSELPCVLDADALNILASPGWHLDCSERDAIITPHPGEAARLLNQTVADIQADRVAAALALAESFQVVAVLKGQGTVIASPEGQVAICTDGNPGMSSGGMGDVLTGVLTALLAQGLTPWQAACLGVSVHSAAADQLAADHGMRGLLASDLTPVIRELLNT